MTEPITLGEVAHAVVSMHLAALLEHEPPARVGDDPEAVHQMRVATRRLRAALRVFEDVSPAPADELRSELAWLAERLGGVRDLDVQMASMRDVAAELCLDAEALAPVLSALETRRSMARLELLEALDAARYVALIGALSALVAQPPGTWPGGASTAAAEALPELIAGRYRRFRKASRDVTSTTPAADLHRARIRAKQLRYSLEFAAELYGKGARRLIRRTVRVQDVLGAIQDAAVMDQRLRGLGQGGHELPAPSVFLLGQLTQHFSHRSEALRGDIADVLRGVDRQRWERLFRQLTHAVVG